MPPPPTLVTPSELRARLLAGEDLCLLDVREEWEFALAHLPGSRHLPLAKLAQEIGGLDPEREIVCICHHGIRSASAALALSRLDFQRVANLVGGLDRWAREVDPSMPRY